jgi:hypothetical protein
MFDPFKGKPKEQPRLIYLGACLIAAYGLRGRAKFTCG